MFYFGVFLVAWQVMTKEVSEIVSKMEKKYEHPNDNSSRLYGSDFCKVIGKGDFGEARR
jgi:hypothetical protein